MPDRDLRQYARGTNRRLIAGLVVIVLVMGGALIYEFYGLSAALLGMVCITAGLLILLVIWGLLIVMGQIVDKYR